MASTCEERPKTISSRLTPGYLKYGDVVEFHRNCVYTYKVAEEKETETAKQEESVASSTN
jgi:hypothetical protein